MYSVAQSSRYIVQRRLVFGVPMDLINPLVRRVVDDARAHPEAFWSNAAENVHWFRK